MPVKRGFNTIQLPYLAGFVKLLCFCIRNTAHSLTAYLQHHTRFLLHIDNIPTLAELVHYRLFAIHSLTFPHGINRNLIMPLITGANDDRINITSVQNFLV